ncbi:MAG: hypothetical protein ACXV5T_03115 [Halobacteriota archaeon]
MELKVKTALETACYYNNQHRDCGKGLDMPSNGECKSCMAEALENIIRLKRYGVAREPTYEQTLKRWKRRT